MRPRRASLEYTPEVRRGGAVDCGSLLARRARLGCAPDAGRGAADDGASMRPRRARLGCNVSSAICRLGSGRFNEAEARAPRMHEIDLHARHGWLVLQ